MKFRLLTFESIKNETESLGFFSLNPLPSPLISIWFVSIILTNILWQIMFYIVKSRQKSTFWMIMLEAYFKKGGEKNTLERLIALLREREREREEKSLETHLNNSLLLLSVIM